MRTERLRNSRLLWEDRRRWRRQPLPWLIWSWWSARALGRDKSGQPIEGTRRRCCRCPLLGCREGTDSSIRCALCTFRRLERTLSSWRRRCHKPEITVTEWGVRLLKRLCKMFSESSLSLLWQHGSCITALGTLRKHFQNFFDSLTPQTPKPKL